MQGHRNTLPLKCIACLAMAAGLFLIGCRTSEPVLQAAATAKPTLETTSLPTPEETSLTLAYDITPVPTLEPTPSPTPSPTPAPTPFTIAWVSDTQVMARHFPEKLEQMADYLLSVREQEGLVCLLHTGDIVDSAITTWQWENVTPPFLKLMDNGVPVYVCAGNHDQDLNGEIGDRLRYYINRELVQASFKDAAVIRRGNAAYWTFEAGGDKFIAMGVSFSHYKDTHDWMVEALQAHSDHIAIIFTHSALENDGSFSADGNRLIWDVLGVCSNVELVLCGHNRGIINRRDGYDDDGDGLFDRYVTTMMMNTQDDWEEGMGFIRFFRFDPADRSLQVRTYSPVLDSSSYRDVPQEDMHFELNEVYRP